MFLSSRSAPSIASNPVGRALLSSMMLVLPAVGSLAAMPVVSTLLRSLTCRYDAGATPAAFKVEGGACVGECWTSEHWVQAVASAVALVVFVPVSVMASTLWQSMDAQLDIKYKNWFATLQTASTLLTAVLANALSNVHPAALSGAVLGVQLSLAAASFTLKPVNVSWCSDLVGCGHLAASIAALVGVLASTFEADRALWWLLLVIGLTSLGASMIGFSINRKTPFFESSARSSRIFTFDPETTDPSWNTPAKPSLRARIRAAASTRLAHSKPPLHPSTVHQTLAPPPSYTPSPVPAPQQPQSLLSLLLPAAPVGMTPITRTRLEDALANWVANGAMDEKAAMRVAGAVEQGDAVLSLLCDRSSDDVKLLSAVRGALDAGMLLAGAVEEEKARDEKDKGKEAGEKKGAEKGKGKAKEMEVLASARAPDVVVAEVGSENGQDLGAPRKPVLLGREDSVASVIGGDDII
ncbi:hypothetical protein HK101_004554 [Irineochytrium annulatum]|nr:hypothetical protein HK101_004554 [Irineochytrium annulatum]